MEALELVGAVRMANTANIVPPARAPTNPNASVSQPTRPSNIGLIVPSA